MAELRNPETPKHPDSVHCIAPATAIATFCDAYSPVSSAAWYHYYGLSPGDGCLALDPLFAYPGNGNWRLGSTSPCIDQALNPDGTGCNDDGVLAVDLDGLTRPYDVIGVPNYGTEAYSDMGAYERQE